MYKLIISVLSLIALVPMQAMAAFSSPADVYRALIASQGMPQSFTATIYAEAEGSTIHGTVSGQVSGRTIADLHMNAQASIDVHSPGTFDATIDMWMRFTDQTLYVRLDSDHPDFASEAAQIGLTNRTWLKFNMQDALGIGMGEWQEVEALQAEIEAKIAPLFNELFDLSSANIAGGAEYTLTLKPNLSDSADSIVALMQSIEPVSNEEATRMTEELAYILEEVQASFFVKMKVQTGNDDVVTNQKMYATIETDEFNGAFESTSELLSEPVMVLKPADRLTINLWEQMNTSLYGDNMNVEYYQQDENGEWQQWDGAVEDYDEWTDEDWDAWYQEWEEEDAWQAEQMSDDDPCGPGMWGRTSGSNDSCAPDRYQEPQTNCAELLALTRPSSRTLEIIRRDCQ